VFHLAGVEEGVPIESMVSKRKGNDYTIDWSMKIALLSCKGTISLLLVGHGKKRGKDNLVKDEYYQLVETSEESSVTTDADETREANTGRETKATRRRGPVWTSRRTRAPRMRSNHRSASTRRHSKESDGDGRTSPFGQCIEVCGRHCHPSYDQTVQDRPHRDFADDRDRRHSEDSD
jgi:hypothetical protein